MDAPPVDIDWTVVKEFFQELLNQPLFKVGGTPVTLMTLVTVVLVLLLAVRVSKLLQQGVGRAFRVRGVRDEGTVRMVQRLLHYTVVVIALISALQTVGINLSSLLAAGAVFAVGFGLAMQSIAQNFVSGIVLLVEHTIRPGDVLEVEGQVVKVSEMSVRATIVRTLDGEDLIVPNSILAQGMVKNYTSRDRFYRLGVRVGVHYDSDLRLVRKVLTEAAARMPWRVEERAPVVLLRDFGSSSVDYDVYCWIDDPWRMEQYRNELREAVWFGFKEQGVVIAFPQLDVHIDEPVVEALRVGRAR